jgi:hypothetical protein
MRLQPSISTDKQVQAHYYYADHLYIHGRVKKKLRHVAMHGIPHWMARTTSEGTSGGPS